MTKLIEKKIPKYQKKGKSPAESSYKPTAQSIFGDMIESQSTDSDTSKKETTVSKILEDISRMKDESGKGEDYKDSLPVNYQSNFGNIPGDHLAERLAGLATVFAGYKNLKNTRDAALKITSPIVEAAIIPNRPIQALPPELINLYLKNIAGINNNNTSDSTANIIRGQMSNINKIAAMDKLVAHQVDNLQKERLRHDKTAAENRIAAVGARKETAKFATDLHNKKAAIEAGYLKSKGDWTTHSMSQLIDTFFKTPTKYNLGVDVQNKQIALNNIQTQINNALAALELEPSNATIRGELDDLRKEQTRLMKNIKLPYYKDAAGSWSGIKPKKQNTV